MNKTEDLKATHDCVCEFPQGQCDVIDHPELELSPVANCLQGINCVVYLQARYEDRLPECRKT